LQTLVGVRATLKFDLTSMNAEAIGQKPLKEGAFLSDSKVQVDPEIRRDGIGFTQTGPLRLAAV
jgi:hypothetical protein